MGRLLTRAEAAATLRISMSKLHLILKADKEFPAYKVGKKTVIDEDALMAWLRKNSVRRPA